MKTYDYNGVKVYIVVDKYTFDDSIAIELYDASDDVPYTRITVCLADDLGLPYFCVGADTNFVDTNNNPGIEDFLEKNKLGKPTGFRASSGWCEYPCYKFNIKKLTE